MAQMEPFGDLSGRLALGEELKDLDLARRQRGAPDISRRLAAYARWGRLLLVAQPFDLADEIARFPIGRAHERDGESPHDLLAALTEVPLDHRVTVDAAIDGRRNR